MHDECLNMGQFMCGSGIAMTQPENFVRHVTENKASMTIVVLHAKHREGSLCLSSRLNTNQERYEHT
jgi:hypothetical protein